MKIIISKSQYSNIFESNNEKQTNLIYKMWNDGMNIYEISELIGLKESQVVIYLKDKHIMVDCGLAYEIVQILYKTSLINKKFNFNNSKMFLEMDYGDFSGSVEFEFNDIHHNLTGMATPYYNGNCSTPVDGSYFQDKNNGLYLDVYDNSGEYIENTPTRFNSIQELIDFLNNDYPKQLIKPIQELILFYKNHMEKYKK